MKKQQLIKQLIEHMYDVEWFNNLNTYGCYGEVDFREDLKRMDITELEALRRYQIEELDDELFYEHVWNGEPIVYQTFN